MFGSGFVIHCGESMIWPDRVRYTGIVDRTELFRSRQAQAVSTSLEILPVESPHSGTSHPVGHPDHGDAEMVGSDRENVWTLSIVTPLGSPGSQPGGPTDDDGLAFAVMPEGSPFNQVQKLTAHHLSRQHERTDISAQDVKGSSGSGQRADLGAVTQLEGALATRAGGTPLRRLHRVVQG